MTNLTKGALALSWIHRGYDLKATAESFAACVKCLLGDKLEDEGSSTWPGRPADRYQRTINDPLEWESRTLHRCCRKQLFKARELRHIKTRE